MRSVTLRFGHAKTMATITSGLFDRPRIRRALRPVGTSRVAARAAVRTDAEATLLVAVPVPVELPLTETEQHLRHAYTLLAELRQAIDTPNL